MRHILILSGLLALAGCRTIDKEPVKEKPVPDPLFTSKKPVEGKPSLLLPVRAEGIPSPPPPPAD